MNIAGKEVLKASVQQSWDALHDPNILKEVIPGCESLELNENGEYVIQMKLGVAAVKGQYTGTVSLDDIQEPNEYVLHAQGSGSPGHVKVKMNCKLSETEKGTRLDWECEADVGGMIASVGSRVLGGIAKYMAGKFFKDIQKQMKKQESSS